MKKNTKILVFVLSLVLLIGAAMSISAAEETPAPEIMAKNVVYGADIRFQFAIDATELGADKTITVKIYDADPTGEANLLDTTTAVYDADVTDTNLGVQSAYIVERTNAAISAVAFGEEFWAVAECDGVQGKAIKYSAVAYFLERLYADGIINATEGMDLVRKEHYENAIAYGSTAQKVVGDTKTNVADYVYVGANGGNVLVDGVSVGSSAILVKGDRFSLAPSTALASGSIALWKDAAGNSIKGSATATASANGIYGYTELPMLTFDGMNDATVTISSSSSSFTTFGDEYAAYNKAFKIYNGVATKNPPSSSIVNEKLVVNSDDGSDYIRFFPTYTEEGYNHVTFEADLTINGTGLIYPVLYESNASSKVFEMKNFSYNASTGEFKVSPTNASGSTGVAIKTTLPTEGENAHTVNLKIDLYDLDGDVLILFYLNGTLSYICDSRLVTDENVTLNFNYTNTDGVTMSGSYYFNYNPKAEGKETPFTKFSILNINTDGGFKGTISIDNVMFMQTKTNEIPDVNTTLK